MCYPALFCQFYKANTIWQSLREEFSRQAVPESDVDGISPTAARADTRATQSTGIIGKNRIIENIDHKKLS